MRIVSLLGSPRPKGNSTVITKHFSKAAEELGAEVVSYPLNKLTYQGCQGCFACKTKLDRCIVEDDLSEVLDAVKDCDALVMSSPVYFGEVTGQLKCFIDRTFSFLTPDYATSEDKTRLKPGKSMVFVITQGHPDEELFADIFPRYDYFFNWLGFDKSHLIRACGMYSLGMAEKREGILKQAEETAKRVVREQGGPA